MEIGSRSTLELSLLRPHEELSSADSSAAATQKQLHTIGESGPSTKKRRPPDPPTPGPKNRGVFRLGDRLGLDVDIPDALLGSSLAFSERSLGSLGRSCGAPGGPERALGGSWGDFSGSRGRLSGRSWALLGFLGPPMAPRTHQNAFARARSSENAAKCFSLEPARARTLLGTRKLSHEPARSKTLESASRSSPL